MYDLIDHTADIGIKVEAPSLSGLFVAAAEALFDITVSSRRIFIPSIAVPVLIEAPSRDQLFVRWLQELLFVFEQRRLVLTKFWIDRMSETRLEGAAKGLPFDGARHTQKLAIKAVTYHRLSVECGADGIWRAHVIFDV